jgi:CarD family transcriptional regulator, regulator of rRNA transcription
LFVHPTASSGLLLREYIGGRQTGFRFPVIGLAGAFCRAQQGVIKRMTAVPQKKAAQRIGFKTGEFIVYPAHGVGQIVNIEEQEVAGHKLELFVIDFQKDKMRLKVPVAKATAIGMRKLSETDYVDRALKVVQGRARIKRTMWSRRAQEYDAKINSGDLISISEVVRDLFRADNQPEQSYSERQLYEAALDRMAREISAVNKMSETEAVRLIEVNLAKGPKRGAKAEADAEVEADTVVEDEQEEAA